MLKYTTNSSDPGFSPKSRNFHLLFASRSPKSFRFPALFSTAETSSKVCWTLSDLVWVGCSTFERGFCWNKSVCWVFAKFLKFNFPLVPQNFLRRFPSDCRGRSVFALEKQHKMDDADLFRVVKKFPVCKLCNLSRFLQSIEIPGLCFFHHGFDWRHIWSNQVNVMWFLGIMAPQIMYVGKYGFQNWVIHPTTKYNKIFFFKPLSHSHCLVLFREKIAKKMAPWDTTIFWVWILVIWLCHLDWGDRLAGWTPADQSHNIRHDLGCGDHVRRHQGRNSWSGSGWSPVLWHWRQPGASPEDKGIKIIKTTQFCDNFWVCSNG